MKNMMIGFLSGTLIIVTGAYYHEKTLNVSSVGTSALKTEVILVLDSTLKESIKMNDSLVSKLARNNEYLNIMEFDKKKAIKKKYEAFSLIGSQLIGMDSLFDPHQKRK